MTPYTDNTKKCTQWPLTLTTQKTLYTMTPYTDNTKSTVHNDPLHRQHKQALYTMTPYTDNTNKHCRQWPPTQTTQTSTVHNYPLHRQHKKHCTQWPLTQTRQKSTVHNDPLHWQHKQALYTALKRPKQHQCVALVYLPFQQTFKMFQKFTHGRISLKVVEVVVHPKQHHSRHLQERHTPVKKALAQSTLSSGHFTCTFFFSLFSDS